MLFAALLAGLSIAGFASQVSAQDSPERDAAMARCIKAAQSQYPSDDNAAVAQRTAAYKACMTAAGQRP
jgi:hypothetical protein